MSPNHTDTPFSRLIRPSTTRRTLSLSSSPSLSSNSSLGSSSFREDSPLFSPSSTPLRSSGIPFSWEKLPGIPKRQLSKKIDQSLEGLLPLPPAGTPIPSKKPIASHGKRDPFFAALIECSKDDDGEDQDSIGNFYKGGSKVTRTFSDRFGLINMYTSCRRACPVSESIIYVPRSVTSRSRPAKYY